MKFLISVLVTMLLLHVAHSELEASSQQIDAGSILDQVRVRIDNFKAYGRETVEILSHIHPEEDDLHPLHHPVEVGGSERSQAKAQEKVSAKIGIAALIISTTSLAVGVANTGLGAANLAMNG